MRRVGHHRGEIVEREHRVHAGQRQRRVLVDAADQRVRMRAAHERRVQHAGQRDVVDEAALPRSSGSSSRRLMREPISEGMSVQLLRCHHPRKRVIQYRDGV